MKNSAKAAFVVASSLFLAGSAFAELTSRSYVKDGLLLHWDGVENTGAGAPHDNSATVWTDLSGSGLDMRIPEDAVFADTGLVTTRAHGSDVANGRIPEKDQAIRKALQNAHYTTEVVFDMTEAVPTANGGAMLSLGNTGDTFIGPFYSVYENRLGFSGNKESSNGSVPQTYVNLIADDRTGLKTYTCWQDSTNTMVKVYSVPNAKSYSKKRSLASTKPDLSTAWKFKFNRGYTENCGINGTYYSVRIYGRSLSTDEMAVNTAVDRIRYCGASASDFTLPDGWKFETEGDETSLYRAVTISARNISGETGVGGTVSIDGGEPVASGTLWCEQGGTVSVTLKAEADEGCAFRGWSGVGDEVKYDAEITVSIDADVAAVFRKTDGSEPLDYTWVGAADGDWDVATNWADADGLAGVPAAGDLVTVPKGKSLTLATSSVALESVTVSGTLVLTNWTTCLSAQTVTVAEGGTLTCAAPATTMDEMSRVWVKCTDLTVAAGGSIDVTRKGYFGWPKTGGASGGGKTTNGWGPGAAPDSTTAVYCAPSHGGYGAMMVHGEYLRPNILPYDDPAAPSQPGSSGGSNPWGFGGDGGGVVRIEATGTVTVNGSILADGRNCSSYGGGGTESNHGQPGAGGSIWITCGTVAGSGVIRAAGGGGDNPRLMGGVPAMSAGGGCIAIDYDASVQTADAVAGMTISAAAGLYRTKAFSTTCFNADTNHWEADIGTLHFTDGKILDALLGSGLTGQIRGLNSYAVEGDLVFTNGHVRFAEEGVKVSVGGNLVLGGTGVARLEIGGLVATNRSAFADLYAGRTPGSLSVAGDLTLGGVSRLDIRAAATNGVDAFGAEVAVGGVMTIGEGCVVTATSDLSNLGAPHFTVGSLEVATGGVFTASCRGGRGGYYHYNYETKKIPGVGSGAGPGRGAEMAGASYGGQGGNSNARQPYGSAERPLLPGSGGLDYAQRALGGFGGGLVFVSATNGTITVDGEISADGSTGDLMSWVQGCFGYGGGGSGGAILLESRIFRLGETGCLLARGGDTKPVDTVGSGAGGGGRIAVWCGEPLTDGTPRGRISSADEPLTPENVKAKHAQSVGGFFFCQGTVSVDGGVSTGGYAGASHDGQPGSTFFAYVGEKTGVMLLIR